MTRLRQKYKNLKKKHERLLESPPYVKVSHVHRSVKTINYRCNVFLTDYSEGFEEYLNREAAHKLGEFALDAGAIRINKRSSPYMPAVELDYSIDIVDQSQ